MIKYYPKENRKHITSFSLKKSGDLYQFSYDGSLVGKIILTVDEYFNVLTDSYNFLLKDLGLDPNTYYIAVQENTTYTMCEPEYREGSIYKVENVNEMGYGVFELKYSHSRGNYFKEYKLSSEITTIVNKYNLKEKVIEFFNSPKDGIRKNKKGFLLYGPPGNGKTTELMQLFNVAEKEKIRVFIVSRKVDLDDLNNMRTLLENEKTVFVFEELTQRTDSDGTEELLTFLDGENSWNNSVTIATTNYPQNLPANLVDRPGRFDTFIEYTKPNKEDIDNLAAKFNVVDYTELYGKDLSYDYVSFIMSKAVRHNISITEAIKREKEAKAKISGTFKSTMGI